MHRVIAALLITWLPVVTAVACEKDPTPKASCLVAVKENAAVARFPLLQQRFVWHWNRSSTRDDHLEYRWLVEFGNCGFSGKFELGDYAFGIQLFKFPGERKRSGMLTDLLRSMQRDFLRRHQEGDTVTFSRIDEAGVVADYRDGSVLVGIRGKEAVAMLTAARPSYALLTVDIPEKGQSYTCISRVHYE